MAKTWHPVRFLDWCLDIDEYHEWFQDEFQSLPLVQALSLSLIDALSLYRCTLMNVLSKQSIHSFKKNFDLI